MSISPVPEFRGIWREDAAARAVYAEAAGIARVMPRAVAVPANADDVVALVRWAHAMAAPLVPRGSGSSMAGGAVGAGVIVDCSRLRDRSPIDDTTHSMWCAPGVLRAEVAAAAQTHAARFPVDPSSGGFCTVGGMAATNAAGPRSLRYGPMRAWVRALDCVFDDGTRATVRRGAAPPAGVPAIVRFLAPGGAAQAVREAAEPLRAEHAGVRKESSGYALAAYAESGDLVDLLVGSEGTLAVFVGIELALEPRLVATASVLATYDSLEAAVVGAATAREAGASACELLDQTFLAFVRDAANRDAAVAIPSGTEAVLLIELEGADARAAAAAAHALGATLRRQGATVVSLALDAAGETALWAIRHAANSTLARLDPALKSMQFVEDGCVPPAALPAYVRGVRAALARHGLRAAIFGHAGDAHVHVNPLVDVTDPAWRARLDGLLADVVALTTELGGTLSGEHGDGRLRAPLLHSVWSSTALALFARVRACFDPAAILNPGVKVALPGQRAIESVKYDPTAPPLPAAADRALATVMRDRAYAAFRLDLLDEPASGPS